MSDRVIAIVRPMAVGLVLVWLAVANFYAQANQPPRAGAVERIKVHGVSLEGNLEGDAPDRDVTIYLPPSYATERSRRYPSSICCTGTAEPTAPGPGGSPRFLKLPTRS